MGYLIVNGQVVGTTFGTPTSFSHVAHNYAPSEYGSPRTSTKKTSTRSFIAKPNGDGTYDYGPYQTEHFYKINVIPVAVKTEDGGTRWVHPDLAKRYSSAESYRRQQATERATRSAMNSGFGIPRAVGDASNSAKNFLGGLGEKIDTAGNKGVQDAQNAKKTANLPTPQDYGSIYYSLIQRGVPREQAEAMVRDAVNKFASDSAKMSNLETATAYAGGVAKSAANAAATPFKKAWNATGGALHERGKASVDAAKSNRNSEIADYDARFSALKSQGMSDEDIEQRIGKRPKGVGKLGTAAAYAKGVGGGVIDAGKAAFNKIAGAISSAKDAIGGLINKYITGEDASGNRKALMDEIGKKFDGLVDALKPSNVGAKIKGIGRGIATSNIGQAAINAGKKILAAPGNAKDAVVKAVGGAIDNIKKFFAGLFEKKQKTYGTAV